MNGAVEVRFKRPHTWSMPYSETGRSCVTYHIMRYAYITAMVVRVPFRIENCMCRDMQP